MKKLSILFSAVLVVAFLASCGSEGASTDGNAGEPVSTVTPNAPATTTPTPPAATPAPTGPTTNMTFDETEFKFGTVDEGEVVSHTFKFTNTGSNPLIISNAKGSCGCTVPQWPREPIPAGEAGSITVEFNSKGKKGPRNQKVTITANTDPVQSFVALVGEVTPAAGAETAAPQIQMNQ